MRQVALLIESSRSYGRGLLRGVAAYMRIHRGWSVRHQEMSIDANPPRWLGNWSGDGILARIESDRMVEAIAAIGIPTVDLRCWKEIAGVPRIGTDDQAVVRLAIGHLRERGFQNFAFCGFAAADYSVRRLAVLREYLAESGVVPEVYESSGPRKPTTMGAERMGMLDEKGVTAWLESLEKPVGLLASNDIRAQQVLQCCAQAGIAVPDDVAVVGIDDDDVVCSMCNPDLTSVEPDTHRIGYEAASLLDRMIAGAEPPADTILIPPKRLIIRGSTDVIPIDDRIIAAAYRYLREHACDGISVEDVVRQVPISRRSLERRMRKYFGRPPADLIAQVRLARIKQLLEETDFPLRKISQLTGFAHDEHLTMFFRKQIGQPPGQYRKTWNTVSSGAANS